MLSEDSCWKEKTKYHWVIGEIGLVGSGITIRVGRFPVLTPLGAWLA